MRPPLAGALLEGLQPDPHVPYLHRKPGKLPLPTVFSRPSHELDYTVRNSRWAPRVVAFVSSSSKFEQLPAFTILT